MWGNENENEGEMASADNSLGNFAVKRIREIRQRAEVDVGSIMGGYYTWGDVENVGMMTGMS